MESKCSNYPYQTQLRFVDAKPNKSKSTASILDCTNIDNNIESIWASCNNDKACIQEKYQIYRKCLPQNSIYYSADRDLNNISQTLSTATKNCKKVKKTKIDVYGKSKKETKYAIEPFVLPSFEKMDMGHQFFIGSFTVLGLFLFYKAFLKK